ncbi:AraC family transcriptional regulator [Pedobacter punctiformis]|uniref:AraC family transcriptional regulator n=1 Tax=Pedobacter punctiformis TaxID=3004097 RepID=A0ABT4LBS4_9SPHI|nr:AraC family transcriptional regulator [Pedobacter sp. HCMS5-2]MCZ4245162.1 AraC family transcriptional regulator [Pedobacter sp. HCMS5-2]
MKIHYEIIKPDENSSIRFLHQNKPTKEFVWEYHYHPEYELVCVFEGAGTRHVGSHLSVYEDGDLVFIGSNVPHSGFGLNARDPHEEIVIQIKPEVLDGLLRCFPEMKNISGLLERSKHGIKFNGPVKTEIKKMLINMKEMKPFEKVVALLEVFNVLANDDTYDILNKQPIVARLISKHRSRLQKIFTYVENYYQKDIDIQEVADLVNISVPSFCNYFKRMTHITFTEFVNRYRVQKSCMLLLQDKTVAEVCFECGFNNVTYFNKIFRKIINKTPSEFRKEN